MAKDDLIRIRLTGAMKRAFEMHAAAFGLSPSERLRALILADLEKRSPLATHYPERHDDHAAVAEPRARRKRTAA